jgi:hypothetical protein
MNISARGPVGTGDSVLILGFVVGGSASKRVLIRGVGPGLAAAGVPTPLAAARVRLFSGAQPIAENAGWSATSADATALAAAAVQSGAFALSPGSKDAAMLMTLVPGAYTVQVSSGDGAATGLALAEIYDLDL